MANFTYSSLGTAGTVQASAADAPVAGHILSITNAPQIDTRTIEKFSITAAVAEVLQVTTVTPTAANSSDFSLVITQMVNGVMQSVTLVANTPASGGTATTICNDWRSQLSANGSRIKITGSGTATFILTAQAGSPIFKVTVISTSSASGTISQSTGTAGVAAVGTYTVLTNQGITTIPALVSGQSYTQVVIQFRQPSINDPAGNVSSSRDTHTVLINEAATNFAALNTRLGEIKLGYGAGVTTADPTFIALTGL